MIEPKETIQASQTVHIGHGFVSPCRIAKLVNELAEQVASEVGMEPDDRVQIDSDERPIRVRVVVIAEAA